MLPDNHQSIVKALVESHTFCAAQNIDDVIQGKGKGIIMLLAGPPGVGKTLTAESVAETMRAPLYSIGAGDLGSKPVALENKLQDIMEMCSKWNAGRFFFKSHIIT